MPYEKDVTGAVRLWDVICSNVQVRLMHMHTRRLDGRLKDRDTPHVLGHVIGWPKFAVSGESLKWRPLFPMKMDQGPCHEISSSLGSGAGHGKVHKLALFSSLRFLCLDASRHH